MMHHYLRGRCVVFHLNNFSYHSITMRRYVVIYLSKFFLNMTLAYHTKVNFFVMTLFV